MNQTSPDNLFQRAIQFHQAGRLADAVMAYRQVLAQHPDSPQCHYNLALALQSLKQDAAAIEGYQQAISLAPGFAEAHNNLGNIFQLQGRLDEAAAAYRRALGINPALAQAEFNLGLTLKKQNRFSQAVEHFRAALAIAPDYAEVLDNLFMLLKQLGRIEEWLEVFWKYEDLASKPDWFFVIGLSACRYLGDFEREARYLKDLQDHSLKQGDVTVLSDLLGKAQYFDLPQAELLRLYRAYNDAVRKQHFAEFPLVPAYRSGRQKIRIGYLSADFRVHVMGKLMHEIMLRHDRNQFDLCLYSLSPQEDELTTEFRNCCDKFVAVHALSARDAAIRIAEDDLDVLVDLCNHSLGSNPLILAYKPARVQITHLGMHGAIGLETVDYKLTDQYADVPENGAYLLEKLLTMQGCIFPFRHVEAVDGKQVSRSSLGIGEDAVVVGVFVNIMKLSPRCLSAWARILQREPRAVLAFSPLKDGDKPSLLRQVGGAGITADRVVFIPASSDEKANRARYRLVDLVLDTFPYSGGDTTLAALDMGVPVVTLCGERHSERTSYSILMHLGLSQTIARNEAVFIDIACRLIRDPDWRASIKDQIGRAMADPALIDMAGYTRNLEEAYREAMRRFAFKDGGDNDSTRVILGNAAGLHQRGNLAEAEKGYQEVLARQPDRTSVLYLYGRLLQQAARPAEALEYFGDAVTVSPAYFDAHLALADLNLQLERYESALQSFNHALQLKPDHAEAMNGLGLALSGLGREQEAVTALNQAISSRPDHAASYSSLAKVLLKLGDLKAAESLYRRALVLNPDDAAVRSGLQRLLGQPLAVSRPARTGGK